MLTEDEAREQLDDSLHLLAELVAWYGHEDNTAYCKRLERAKRFLRRKAPELLKHKNKAVKEAEWFD